MDFSENIKAGMAWLDDNRPGWEFKIDLETLNLNSVYNCVLGQVFGSYYTVVGYGWSRLKDGDSLDYGFTATALPVDTCMSELTEQWCDAIRVRLDTYAGVERATVAGVLE